MGETIINEGSAVSSPLADSTSAAPWLTYSDLYEHLFNFSQGSNVGAPTAVIRGAVVSAYEEVIQAHDWSFLRGVERIYGYATQTDGTLSYNSSTRVATLTDATFPSWADGQGGAIYVDDVICEIEARLSSTTVRLRTNRNPETDLTAESYKLFKHWYALPQDFMDTKDPTAEDLSRLGRHLPFSQFPYIHQSDQTTGDFRYWCIGLNPNGGHALYVYPALTSATRIDLPYSKRPRDVAITGVGSAHRAGTISVSGTTVTGTDTAFTSAMAGSILRVSSTSAPPDGVAGMTDNLFAEERLISSVTDATTLTLAVSGTTATDVGYRISDPLSVGRCAWNALRRCAELHLARARGLKTVREHERAYMVAINKAKGDDAVEQPDRIMGRRSRTPTRLADRYVVE
jgi:hypothetical protein